MRPTTYLSIDLDYFESRKQTYECLSKALLTGHTIVVVADHHQLLPYINQTGGPILINVDAHDDLKVEGKEVSESNWVEHVVWRHEGHYIWVHAYHPNDLPIGYCGKSEPPEMEGHWPRSSWKYKTKQYGYEHIPWGALKGIGIAISSSLSDYYGINWFAEGILDLHLQHKVRLGKTMKHAYYINMLPESQVRVQCRDAVWSKAWPRSCPEVEFA